MFETTRNTTKRQTAALAGLLLTALIFMGCGGSGVEAQGATVEERLAVLEADLAERERALAEREQALTAESEELAERQKRLAESEREIEGRIDGVAERAAGVNQQAEELRRREVALAESEARLAAERQAQARALAEARAEAEREAARAAEIAQQNPPEVYAEAILVADTRLEVEFLSTVSSASSRPGDRFVTRVTRDLSADDGRLVVPAGTELEGMVTEAVSLKRVGGQARLGMAFGELHLPWGKSAEIDASFYDAGRNESRRDRRIIGGAAAGGAVLGAILDDDEGRGTILGAIIGAAAGTAAAANKARDEVEIPGGTVVTLQLDTPAQIQVPWRSRYIEAERTRGEE